MNANKISLLLVLVATVGVITPIAHSSPAPAAAADADADCAATGRNCRGGVRDPAVLRSETRLMRLFFDEMGLKLPAACAAHCDQLRAGPVADKCVGACYDAMLRSVNLERQLLS